MKIRSRGEMGRVQLNMTPVISVVFLLIIFYLCTPKASEPEIDFEISMPLSAPDSSAVTESELPPFKVRLMGDDKGELTSVIFNGSDLGGGQEAFAMLNFEIFRAITAMTAIGPDEQEKQEVEIDPDYNLQYQYIISAIGSCSGGLGKYGVPIRYISRIKFAPRRDP